MHHILRYAFQLSESKTVFKISDRNIINCAAYNQISVTCRKSTVLAITTNITAKRFNQPPSRRAAYVETLC